MNQIEIVFSVIQRKVIKPADFADLDALADRLAAFEGRYNATATPFDWNFTRADLLDLLRAHRRPPGDLRALPGSLAQAAASWGHARASRIDQDQPQLTAVSPRPGPLARR